MQTSEGEPLTLPITLRPREEGDGWRAEVDLGGDAGYWSWSEGETRYEAVRDALYAMAVEMDVLHQDRTTLGPATAADYAALRAWVGEAKGAGDGND